MTVRRLVVMGPSGSGKSHIGALLAERLGLAFIDADDLHPAANVVKMTAGIPLNDEDRMPWLDVVGATLASAGGGAVVACSALARRYRARILVGAADVRFVALEVDTEVLARRMASREHFMPPSLLVSQLAAFESLGDDEPGFAVDGGLSPAAVVDEICARVGVGQSL